MHCSCREGVLDTLHHGFMLRSGEVLEGRETPGRRSTTQEQVMINLWDRGDISRQNANRRFYQQPSQCGGFVSEARGCWGPERFGGSQ